MIVFNHNIVFPDEPLLQDDNFDPALNEITIVHSKNRDLGVSLPEKSEWIPMALQQARYSAEREFSTCQVGCRWGLEIRKVVSLFWCNGSGKIEYLPHQDFTPERLRFWLLHTLLPVVFTLQQQYEFLHVGAVEIDDKPVLFSADSFGGKSTLTDYFIQQGHNLLSDDSLGIDRRGDQFYAIPSYPFHRPYRTPEDLGYPAPNMATGSKPVHAVYRLQKSAANDPVHISEITGVDKFKAFHFTSFINFSFLKQHRFNFLADMAKVIPTYTVSVPWELERLSEVHHALVAHSRKL